MKTRRSNALLAQRANLPLSGEVCGTITVVAAHLSITVPVPPRLDLAPERAEEISEIPDAQGDRQPPPVEPDA